MPQVSKGARLWLWKRKGFAPIWYIRDGEFRQSTGCSAGEREKADQALADYITSRRPDTSRRDSHEIGVAEVLNLYQMDLPQNKPSRELIGYHVANLLQYWGGKSLAEVKGSTCREYLVARTTPAGRAKHPNNGSQSSVKPSTVRRELKTLSAAINHWHKESPLAAVPEVTLPEEGARRERVLERDEAARMLRACRKRKWPHLARFILIGLHTGTRRSAILALRWESAHTGGHFDAKRDILYRRGSGEPETSKRRPPVQIRGALRGFLHRWKRMTNATHIVSYHGSGIRSIKHAWDTIREDAGLGKDVTPHVLRHTCATWMLWDGQTIWDVAEVIGASATMVERVYGHPRIKDEKRKA